MATALPSTPDQRPSAADFDSIIRIKVGKDEQVFEIYKGVLKFYSGYFRSAIENIENGRFKEAEENVITLPDEELEVFKLFKGWLYTRELPKEDNSNILVKLWGFADRRIVPLLQNEAIDAIQAYYNENWKVASPALVYRSSGVDSALRRFIICSYGACLSKIPEDRFEKCPQEFKDDLLKYILEQRPDLDPRGFEKRDMCEWHVHEEGVRCSKK